MRNRIPEIRTVFASLGAALLFGCGGGSSGGTSGTASPSPPSASTAPSPTPPLTTSFPLATALATLSANGLSASLNASGTVKGVSVSGTGSFSESAAIAAMFAGQAALQQIVALNATLTANIIPVSYSYSTVADMYSDSSYRTLGMTDTSEYDVAAAPFSYPTTVTIGETGSLGTMNRYSDSTKTTVLGTIASTYRVEADTTPNTAIFDEVDQSLDLNHNVTTTVEIKYRITSTGGISLAGVSVVNSNANVSATAV